MQAEVSYTQDAKHESRRALWKQAVRRLTTNRTKASILSEEYMRNLWSYCLQEVLRPYARVKDLDHSVLDGWCTFAKSRYGTKQSHELKVAYLSGPEPENDLNVLLSEGISVANVWAFESNSSLYSAALAKAAASHPGLKIYPGAIESFVELTHEQFDIIYLDFTGPLVSASTKPFRALHAIFERRALADLSILIVNTSEPDANDDAVSMLASYFQNQDFVEGSVYGLKDNDGRPLEHLVEGPDSYGYDQKQLKVLIKENFSAAYSSFATQYPALYANYVQPAHAVLTNSVAKKRFFNPDEEALQRCLHRFSSLDAFISNFLSTDDADRSEANTSISLGSDLVLTPHEYPLQHFLLGLTSQKSKDARSFLGFFDEKSNGVPRSEALLAFDVLRSITEGYWDVLSNPMLQTVRELQSTIPDANAPLFCDVPMPHLWAEAGLYQLGMPHHINLSQQWRVSYVAKTRRMHLDSFVFDRCRAFYDWIPGIELYGKIFESVENQLIFRICMDAICKARGYLIPQLYAGANVICLYTRPWAKLGELQPRMYLN